MFPIPTFYDPANVGRPYEPDFQAAYQAGLKVFHGFQKTAAADQPRILAWLIDMQGDFIYPAPLGRLSVPGAVADSQRTIEWLYRNVQHLTEISASLDTHTPYQIFYPTWWKNRAGDHPAPYTVISAQQVKDQEWLPTLHAEWSLHYVETLEKVGRKQLMIWPFHCMEGTAGRALLPALSEAIMYHSGARMAQPVYLPKGTLPYTEYYSVVEPEVKYPNHPDGGLNTRYLESLATFDLIYVAGQARSHCVLESVASVVRYFADRPAVLQKFRFLEDCSSCITGFEAATEARFNEFATAGVRMVKSTDLVG